MHVQWTKNFFQKCLSKKIQQAGSKFSVKERLFGQHTIIFQKNDFHRRSSTPSSIIRRQPMKKY